MGGFISCLGLLIAYMVYRIYALYQTVTGEPATDPYFFSRKTMTVFGMLDYPAAPLNGSPLQMVNMKDSLERSSFPSISLGSRVNVNNDIHGLDQRHRHGL